MYLFSQIQLNKLSQKKTTSLTKEKTCFDLFLFLVVFMSLCNAQSYLMHRKKLFTSSSLISIPEKYLELISWITHCAQELFESIFILPLKLGPKCCTTVKKINNNCLDDIINKFPLDDILLLIYNSLCKDEKL